MISCETGSDSGCDGRWASTELDEGVLAYISFSPPLVDDYDIRS
jgi:hypothetical protein